MLNSQHLFTVLLYIMFKKKIKIKQTLLVLYTWPGNNWPKRDTKFQKRNSKRNT
jgi:hypothetical protein